MFDIMSTYEYMEGYDQFAGESLLQPSLSLEADMISFECSPNIVILSHSFSEFSIIPLGIVNDLNKIYILL